MKVYQLETPSLVVDEEIFERNEAAMKALLSDSSLSLRPHYKSHKCSSVARRQIASGAIGMTCAKLSEAEDLVDTGIEDVLIANQIVDLTKIRRAAELARLCRLTVCVDDAENAVAFSQAACDVGATVHVLVEYETGMERCGVETPGEYLELASLVNKLPGLVYDGIQAYAGHVSHCVSETERQSMIDAIGARLTDLIACLKAEGIPVNTVSGGSTGTAAIKAEQGLYTELQAGSYLFMDSTYRDLALPFQNSLFLLATVISRRDGLTILDAGVKSLGFDQNDPICLDENGEPLVMDRMEANEEHLKLFGLKKQFEIGDKIRIIPGHCCSTVNLHDKIYFYRGDTVTDRVFVTARGKSK